MLLVVVQPYKIQDRDGAKPVLYKLIENFGWLKLIWVDGGYSGKLIGWVAALTRHRKLKLEIIKRSDQTKGFKILPRAVGR